MVRGVPAILRDPLAWLERAVTRHGDLVALPMPRLPVLLVNTPAAARRVLQENHRGYDKGTVQYRALATVTGSGLLTSDGETWRTHRRTLQPAFHPAALPGLLDRTLAAARWDLPPGRSVRDADLLCVRVMLDVVAATLGGTAGRPEGHELIDAVDVALRAVVRHARTPWAPLLDRVPTPARRRRRAAVATLDDVCARLVAARRSAAASGAGDDGRGDDVLGVLLAAADAGVLPPEAVRDELVTAVIAGHETVAAALTWTLHLLAANPGAQARLHDELDAVLTGRPTSADLTRLPWTRAVVEESLRLFPPAWVISRRATAPDRIDGIDVPAGTLVLISPWLLHRRAADWDAPREFRPERFEDGAGRPMHGRGHIPFGAGPRLCIGRDLGRAQAVLLLADLLRDHEVRPPTGLPEPRVDAQVTLRPVGGLMLEFVTRSGGLPFGRTSAIV
jgi:cytochrome P450